MKIKLFSTAAFKLLSALLVAKCEKESRIKLAKRKSWNEFQVHELYGGDVHFTSSLSILMKQLIEASESGEPVVVDDISGAVEELKALRHQLNCYECQLHS